MTFVCYELDYNGNPVKSLNITVDPEKYEPLRKNIILFYGTTRGIVQIPLDY